MHNTKCSAPIPTPVQHGRSGAVPYAAPVCLAAYHAWILILVPPPCRALVTLAEINETVIKDQARRRERR